MTARPRPLSAATTGSSTGSAYGATMRTTTCAAMTSGGQPAAVPEDVGRDLALDADADRGVGADADREREDEQEELRAPAAPVHEAQEGAGLCHRHQPTAALEGPVVCLAAEVVDGAPGVVEAAGVDALADLARRRSRRAGRARRRWSRTAWRARARQVGVEAAEDHDRAVLLADVVLVLAPGPGRGERDPDQADDDQRRRAAGCSQAKRRGGRGA